MSSAKKKRCECESVDTQRKRSRPNYEEGDKFDGKSVRNLKIACEQVSRKNYLDNRKRFLLVYLPLCVTPNCKHKNKVSIHQIPPSVDNLFNTEIRTNAWYEALEVCRMSISPTQYLSADILKNIVELMLNVHEDTSVNSVKYIVNNCQQILLQHFSTHPPCQDEAIRNCYVNFLASPMDEKKGNKFTDRHKYEANKGILKYCINRLDAELSADSKDEPIIDKNDERHIPLKLEKDSVSAKHYQKRYLEIFESLNRTERIERLFTVLETLIELFQFDLAIGNTGSSTKRSKLLDKALLQDIGTDRQLLKIFVKVIHLQYPEQMVKTFAIWINTVIETLYASQVYCYLDYPTISTHCNLVGQTFYKVISESVPPGSIVKILERIEPAFMRHFVGLEHLNMLLSTKIANVVDVLINFLDESTWELYPTDSTEINLSSKLFIQPVKVTDKQFFLMNCLTLNEDKSNIQQYAKMMPKGQNNATKPINSLNYIIHTFYITLDAYIDAYDVRSVYQKWNALKKGQKHNENSMTELTGYSISGAFLNTYKRMFTSLFKLNGLFQDLKNQGTLPESFYILESMINFVNDK